MNVPEAAPQSISPSYLMSLLGGQVPQATPQTVQNIPQVDPNAVTSAISSNLQPTFQQQDTALQEQLANLGIFGGPTSGALAQLGKSQQSQLASDVAPYIMQAQTGNQNAALQGGEFNATAANRGQEFNVGNLLTSAGIDQATFNQFLSGLMGYQNQDWLAQLGAASNLNNNQAQGQQQAFQPNYQQPSPVNFGGLASAAGSAFQPNNQNIMYQASAPGNGSIQNPGATASYTS